MLFRPGIVIVYYYVTIYKQILLNSYKLSKGEIEPVIL